MKLVFAIATFFLLGMMDANASSCQVKSHKTGATAKVSCEHQAKFQGYIDEIDANGGSVRFMGGIRKGKCSNRHMHPCGRALDVCQLGRGIVDKRCNLPPRRALAVIAQRHGLFEGGRWCKHDYGHAQVGISAAACGEKTYAHAR